MSRLQDAADTLAPSAPAGEEEKQTPLMASLVQSDQLPEADGFEPPPRSSPTVSGGTLLILLAAVVAAGAMYVMRTLHAKPVADANAQTLEAKIEQALVKLTNPQAMAAGDPLAGKNMQALFRDTDSIVNMFSQDNTLHQVPVEDLKKNPFEMTLGRANDDPAAAGGEALEARKLATEFKDLRLDTVMQGPHPVAIINGRLVRVGDRLGSFTVKAIVDLSVQLESAGQSYTLTMDVNNDAADGAGKRR